MFHQDLSSLQAKGADGPAAEATEEGRLHGVEGNSTRGLLGRREVIQLAGEGGSRMRGGQRGPESQSPQQA